MPSTPTSTNATTPSASTSTPEGASISIPKKLRVRRLGAILTAVEAQKKETITLASGDAREVRKGDWIIHQGETVLAALTTDELLNQYDLVQEHSLLLDRPTCEAVEQRIGLGSTRTSADLLRALDRLASLRIGEVRIDFTPGQLEELVHRADKRGITLAQEIARVVDRIKEELFYRS